MGLLTAPSSLPVRAGPVGVAGPVIANVQVASITGTTAAISWTTDLAASSQIEYGTSVAYGQVSLLDTTTVTGHTILLTGLNVNTTYHFRVWSAAGGLQSVSIDSTFTTAPTALATGALDAASQAPPLPLYLQPGQDELTIRSRIAARLTGGLIDLSEGSFEMDWIRLNSFEFALLPPALWRVLRSTFMQNPECVGILADLRAAEEGVDRLVPRFATVPITIYAPPGTVIPSGYRVATGTAASGVPVVFAITISVTVPAGATSVVATGIAQVAGVAGNVPAGAVTIPVDQVTGVTQVANLVPASGGAAAESNDSLKNRYFSAIRNRGTSGNKAQWRNWALSVPGVGDVAIVRTPTGAGSVGVSLLGVDGNPASAQIVAAVQQLLRPIDPTVDGLAPIGPSELRVYSAPSVIVNVSASVTYAPGASAATVRANIAANIADYLAGLSFNPVDNSVHPDQIGVVISQTSGVLYYDLSSLRVNNDTKSVVIAADSVAVLGTVAV